MTTMQQFQGEEFLSLETFRQNGLGVKIAHTFAQGNIAPYTKLKEVAIFYQFPILASRPTRAHR